MTDSGEETPRRQPPPGSSTSPDATAPDDAERTRAERYHLVADIEAVLDGPATYLALLFAALLVAEIALTAQGMAVPAVLGWIQLVIWGVFIVHFLLG